MRTYADHRKRVRVQSVSVDQVSRHYHDDKAEEDLETANDDMPERGVNHPGIITPRGRFGVRPRLLRDSSDIYLSHGDFRGCSTLFSCYRGAFCGGCFVVIRGGLGARKRQQKTDETKKRKGTGTQRIHGTSWLLKSSQILGASWPTGRAVQSLIPPPSILHPAE